MSAADTLIAMDPSGPPAGGRYDELLAESTEALAYAANTVRAARDGFRQAYLEEAAHLELLRDELESLEQADEVPLVAGIGAAAATGEADGRLRTARADLNRARDALGHREAELGRLVHAVRNLEATWLFLERGDSSLITDIELPKGPAELQMRMVEAQEAERVRMSKEVHDGPAQALSNAIFQVEFIDRVFDSDQPLARTELRMLRELLRRELDDVRSFIRRLRPPVLAELGLDGAIQDAVSSQAAVGGLHVTTDLRGSTSDLPEASQTVALRVLQEALQNVRKHAVAKNVTVTSMLDDGQWVLEIRDDGRGFETGAVAARGRRNFGLQFMRERAELIGAMFEVRSSPQAGTVVRLAIPLTRKENG